jgi:GT2 family glycosyltransferase
VGYLDVQFIKYFEDVDICLRMGLAGWRVMYHGATFCYHLEQRASARLLSADAYLHLRAYLRWIRKWGVAPRGLAAPPAAGRRAG